MGPSQEAACRSPALIGKWAFGRRGPQKVPGLVRQRQWRSAGGPSRAHRKVASGGDALSGAVIDTAQLMELAPLLTRTLGITVEDR